VEIYSTNLPNAKRLFQSRLNLITSFLAQLALLGLTAHVQILLIPVCHVQLTQPQAELLLQLALALQDTSELHRMIQRLDVLVSQITVCLQGRRGRYGR